MHLSFGTNSVGIRNLSVKQMEVGTLPCGKLMTTKKSIKSIKPGPEMNIQERHHFKQSTIYSFALYIDPMSSVHLSWDTNSKTSNGLSADCEF